MMMDASLRRSVCLLGSVLAVLLLLAWPSYGEEHVVYFEPYPAVRGYPLDVIANVGESTDCTLTMARHDAFALPSFLPANFNDTDSDFIWPFDKYLSVRVLVNPTLPGPLDVSVKCGGAETKGSVAVVSDVDVVAVWSASASPADEFKPLAANLALTNQGGHTAVSVACDVSSVLSTPFNLTCGGAVVEGGEKTVSCQLGSMTPHTPVLLQLNFANVTKDDNVTVKCSAHNVVDNSLSFPPFEILLKGDAIIKITPAALDKVSAGLNATVETTFKNEGRAKADNLVCVLAIDKPESTVLVDLTGPTKDKCALVQSSANVTTGARCEFGDLESQANVAVSLVLHVDAAAKADNFNLVWSCNAASLPSVNKSIAIPTQVEANFTLALPTNSSIAAGTQALLFRMKNPGPSFIRDGSCNFTLPKGVKSDVWSSSKYFTCVKDETKRTGGLTMLNCVIEELPPADTEFNLSLKLEDITLEDFAIAAECEMKSPEVSFKKEFEAYVGIVPSPSPAPSGSVPAPDNSMMVVVTVIVAVGLLIVIAIWWRRRQESSGWDAAGPTARSPSLNRFTDMELSVRSDD